MHAPHSTLDAPHSTRDETRTTRLTLQNRAWEPQAWCPECDDCITGRQLYIPRATGNPSKVIHRVFHSPRWPVQHRHVCQLHV